MATRNMTKEYWKKLYLTKKEQVIRILGGKCVKCGSTENLEFDHINPIEKNFTITTRIRQNISEEIKKCQLLCRSCHRDKTGRTTHGKRRMYQNGCRCEACKGINRSYIREYKRSVRQAASQLSAK